MSEALAERFQELLKHQLIGYSTAVVENGKLTRYELLFRFGSDHESVAFVAEHDALLSWVPLNSRLTAADADGDKVELSFVKPGRGKLAQRQLSFTPVL